MPDDIKISWDVDLQHGDFNFDTAVQDLESDAGLETAVLISLFTDRRANIDDPLPDSNNTSRRGWWGDLASPEVEGDQIGSRLWLLEREKTLESVLTRAKQYTIEALQWLIDDGVAEKVDVSTERLTIATGYDVLAILGEIFKPDGSTYPFKYEAQWISQGLR